MPPSSVLQKYLATSQYWDGTLFGCTSVYNAILKVIWIESWYKIFFINLLLNELCPPNQHFNKGFRQTYVSISHSLSLNRVLHCFHQFYRRLVGLYKTLYKIGIVYKKSMRWRTHKTKPILMEHLPSNAWSEFVELSCWVLHYFYRESPLLLLTKIKLLPVHDKIRDDSKHWAGLLLSFSIRDLTTLAVRLGVTLP